MSPKIDDLQRELAERVASSSAIDVFEELSILLDALEDPTRFLEALLQTAKRAFMADRAAVVTYHRPTCKWFVEASDGLSEATMNDLVRYSKTIARQTYDTGESVLVTDAPNDPLTRESRSVKEFNIKTVLCAPIMDTGGNVTAVIYLDCSSAAGTFDQHDQERLRRFARFCTSALQRSTDVAQLGIPPQYRTVAVATPDDGFFNFRSAAMEQVMRQLQSAARHDATLLIMGENGVGKDFLARWVHANSPRAKGPFVHINLPELAPSLMESELFGVENNTATQVKGRDGLIRKAVRGTVFLNEIAELELNLQAKLLGTIENKTVRRVGDDGNKEFPIDVRFICATNQDLPTLVENREFRMDLYYRINILEVRVPPLRERPEDIQPLAEYILRRKCIERGHEPMEMPHTVINHMEQMPWKGNIRELASSIDRVVMSTPGREFPIDWSNSGEVSTPLAYPTKASKPGEFRQMVSDFERQLITEALRREGWVKTRAAAFLGLGESTLRARMKALKIKEPRRF